MRAHPGILLAVILAVTGCGKAQPKRPVLNITLRNSSSNALDWVEFDWAGPDVGAGILSPGIGKTALDVKWPNIPSGKLTFVDDKTRKPYSLEVPLTAANEQVRSGRFHQVIIRILDYDKADVICE